MPVFTRDEFAGNFLNIPMSLECVMIPFMMTSQQVGAMFAVHSDTLTEEFFDSEPLLDGELTWMPRNPREEKMVVVELMKHSIVLRHHLQAAP